MEFLRKLWSEEEGQGMVEYALIIALVAVLLIAALGTLQGGIDNVFTKIGERLGLVDGGAVAD